MSSKKWWVSSSLDYFWEFYETDDSGNLRANNFCSLRTEYDISFLLWTLMIWRSIFKSSQTYLGSALGCLTAFNQEMDCYSSVCSLWIWLDFDRFRYCLNIAHYVSVELVDLDHYFINVWQMRHLSPWPRMVKLLLFFQCNENSPKTRLQKHSLSCRWYQMTFRTAAVLLSVAGIFFKSWSSNTNFRRRPYHSPKNSRRFHLDFRFHFRLFNLFSRQIRQRFHGYSCPAKIHPCAEPGPRSTHRSHPLSRRPRSWRRLRGKSKWESRGGGAFLLFGQEWR